MGSDQHCRESRQSTPALARSRQRDDHATTRAPVATVLASGPARGQAGQGTTGRVTQARRLFCSRRPGAGHSGKMGKQRASSMPSQVRDNPGLSAIPSTRVPRLMLWKSTLVRNPMASRYVPVITKGQILNMSSPDVVCVGNDGNSQLPPSDVRLQCRTRVRLLRTGFCCLPARKTKPVTLLLPPTSRIFRSWQRKPFWSPALVAAKSEQH